MNCRTFVELITAYLEDELGPRDRTAFEDHLGRCAGCERYLSQFRTTISLLGELPEESISPAVRSRLLHAFADWSAHGGQPGERGE